MGCLTSAPPRPRLGWLPLDTESAVEDLDDYAPEPGAGRRAEAPVTAQPARVRRAGPPSRGGGVRSAPAPPAPLAEVHAYLRSRLLDFPLETLYELHYQVRKPRVLREGRPWWPGASLRSLPPLLPLRRAPLAYFPARR